MTLEEIQFIARQVGLTVERQPIGFRLRNGAGGVIASHLPKDHIEDLVQGMGLTRAIQSNMVRLTGLLL
jgi:hypothetical protein